MNKELKCYKSYERICKMGMKQKHRKETKGVL
jgi:hypothetical protein